MKKVYLKIWNLALPYYKKGRPMDIAHVKWMMKDAVFVCKHENIDESLLLPLVILHDVGYGVNKHVYYEKELKKEHMGNGKKIARQILKQINYPKDKIERIEYYISVHDNWLLDDNSVYKNDLILGAFNDLDYMWMATPKGFPVFVKILNKTPKKMIMYLKTNDKIKFRPFSTKTTRNLYFKYLNDRKKENP